jgi:tetratricopeptide (TPR) repeat protein
MIRLLARWQWERAYRKAREALRAGHPMVGEDHARQALRWAQRCGAKHQIMAAGASLMVCAALREQRRYDESEAVALAAMAALEGEGRITQEDHVRLAALTAELGRAQMRQGKLDAAEETAARCEAHAESAGESAYLAVSATLWSDLRLRQGRLREAADWLRRAKGWNAAKPAGAHLNLGKIYLSARRADLALEEYQAAVRGYEEAGAGAGEFSVALMNLGTALSALGRDVEAESRHRAALRLGTCPGGWSRLAMSLAKQGKTDEAEKAILEAARNGEEEASIAYARGLLRQAQGRWGEAEAAFLCAVRRKEAMYGTAHPMVVDELEALAQAMEAQGRKLDAEPLRAEVGRILDRIGRV